VETKANDISAYIPTNVISITDGQCFFQSDLFNAGVRPAVDVGTSVSRVGGSAQVRAMRKVSGSLRVDLAQYRDLEAFAAFASDLDDASKAQLARGERIVELLKQPQYAPFPVEHQVVSIWSGTSGELDEVPVRDVRRFEREFLDYLLAGHRGILETIRETGQFDDDTAAALKSAVSAFKDGFVTHDGTLLRGGEEAAEGPMSRSDVAQESIARHVPSPEK
jgi:F-type H+-transporting ATPase subunit alpha